MNNSQIRTLSELLDYMHLGCEIDFTFNKLMYFLQPEEGAYKCNGAKKYILCDENSTESRIIFIGTDEEILDYKFEGKYSLRNNFSMFAAPYFLR